MVCRGSLHLRSSSDRGAKSLGFDNNASQLLLSPQYADRKILNHSRLRRLQQEYGDLSRFTPSEVEDLMMGCSTSEPGDQEPKSFEPGDQEPKSFEPGDREPKSFEPGDHEPKSSEPGDREPPVDPTAGPNGCNYFVILLLPGYSMYLLP